MIKQENFAVFAHDRTQYVAIPGKTVDIEKLEIEEGKEYIIDNVLLVKVGEHIEVGKPNVKTAKIICKVVGTFKDEKVKIFKYHAKSRTRKAKGHRQQFTRLEIIEIIAKEGVSAKLEAPTKKEKKVVKTEVKKEAVKESKPKRTATKTKTTTKKVSSKSVKKTAPVKATDKK
ncbi:MAG TPA: 50S ribosomal protein L21 [Candidatus Dojkabacteria bacterium]|nr:50S ribosomal protein L21 [Candidatus Dojkabacteria bacterium]HQF37221.1 50S ribosomal protein L21 [Candidatus Dojkabacteria bacterium]